MQQPSDGYVFISYSRRDAEMTRRIVSFLRAQGIKVWVDNEKLVPGTPFGKRKLKKPSTMLPRLWRCFPPMPSFQNGFDVKSL